MASKAYDHRLCRMLGLAIETLREVANNESEPTKLRNLAAKTLSNMGVPISSDVWITVAPCNGYPTWRPHETREEALQSFRTMNEMRCGSGCDPKLHYLATHHLPWMTPERRR